MQVVGNHAHAFIVEAIVVSRMDKLFYLNLTVAQLALGLRQACSAGADIRFNQ